MTNIQNVIDHAEQKCNSHGSRLTHKRKQVLTGLLQSGIALSAYELADYCKSENADTIPVMSVYRILDFLESEQLVHKLKLANKFIACSHISCSHSHGVPQFLICNQCQRVREISITQSILKSLQRNVEQAGYHLLSPQLEMNCLCDECNSKAA